MPTALATHSKRAQHPIAVTMGDPGGCGPQITLKAWQSRRDWSAPPFFVIANEAILKAVVPDDCRLKPIDHPEEALSCFEEALPFLPLECPVISPGDRDPAGAAATIQSIDLAVERVHAEEAGAVVTNPINKAVLAAAGFKHPGHTEYLAELAAQFYKLDALPRPIMMLTGGGLRVALATIHIPLAKVCAAIRPEVIRETAIILHATLKRDFAISHPRIALAGVNPHAGEEGVLGREEIEIINPTAEQLRRDGFDVSDAQPGDTVFVAMLEGRYDAVIAMYHDQGLAPLKTLDIWGGVNSTIGLPFIRTSPDHGTAYDMARSFTARPDSLIAAIRLADEMARARKGG